MLPRPPSRIELSASDKEEYEQVKRLQQKKKALQQEEHLADPLQV
jgi:hypothetical protein